MKLLAYLPEDDLKELARLCLSLLQKNKKTIIVVESIDVAHIISDVFWKLHKFLPHGIIGEKFAEIQPIMISNKMQNYPNIVCYKFIPDSMLSIDCECLILWNYSSTIDPSFTIYKQNNDGWVKL